MPDAPLWLVVRQRPIPHPGLESLVGELQGCCGLDHYTTRQRLLGSGLAQLAQGAEPALAGPVAILRRHGYACWLIAPPRPAFAPPRLRSLIIGSDAVDFLCDGERRVRLQRGMSAVGVLADLSAELAGRQAKRMLAQHAYLGRDQTSVFTPEETRQAIFKGQPVFDCYLLDEQGRVCSAVRVFPGRFNPEGLGGRAGLGVIHNLEAMIKLVGEYAGAFRLHSDFGLSQLPGCLPQLAKDDSAALSGNLDALSRYGWLVAGLTDPAWPSDAGEAVSPGVVAAATIAGLAVAGDQSVVPAALGAVAAGDAESAERPVGTRPPPLPPPPERPEQRFSLRRVLPVAATFAGGTLLVMAGRTGLLQSLIRQGVQTGLLPGMAAVALCWGAFACLRRKRLVEDTPTSHIRSLAMGLVEIQGRAIRRYALVAPMTQSACVWYRLRKYRRDTRNNWRMTSESDSSHVPFILDDGSGRVVVDPAGATIKARSEQTGHPGEATLIGAALDGGPDEKWVEELIFEGTTLYLLGYARPVRAAGAGLRERTVEALRRLKLDPQALRRYDTNGDGRLDADEWQTARAAAEQLAAVEQLGEQRAPVSPHVLLGKPPHGLPFLIAEAQSGTQLARSYGWLGAGALVLAVVAFALALKLSLEFFWLI